MERKSMWLTLEHDMSVKEIDDQFITLIGISEEEIVGNKISSHPHVEIRFDKGWVQGETFFARIKSQKTLREYSCVFVLDPNEQANKKKLTYNIYFSNPVLVPVISDNHVFKEIFEKAAVGVALVSTEGKILRVNSAFEKCINYSEKELQEMTFPEFTHPEDIDKDVEYYAQLLKGDIKDYQMEKRYITKEGNSIWVHLSVSLMYNQRNEVKYAVAVVQDIDQVKKTEKLLQSHYEAIEASNKELEKFAYVASHDLQEPLRTINSFLDLFQDSIEVPINEEAQYYLDTVGNASNRMRSLIDDLLNYSRIGSSQMEYTETNMKSLIDDVRLDLMDQIQKSSGIINIKTLKSVNGDKSKLYRLFKNLISNSLKFRKEEVSPVVTIDSKVHDDRIVYRVSDNGIGISNKFHKRVFEIFQRLHTREEYKGSGIGLAICKKIVELHKGNISIESKVGDGTTFIIDLPKY